MGDDEEHCVFSVCSPRRLKARLQKAVASPFLAQQWKGSCNPFYRKIQACILLVLTEKSLLKEQLEYWLYPLMALLLELSLLLSL